MWKAEAPEEYVVAKHQVIGVRAATHTHVASCTYTSCRLPTQVSCSSCHPSPHATPNQLHSQHVHVCPNTPSISVPIGAAADAILRQKEKAQTENMQRKDNAKKKATELLAGKTIKKAKEKNQGC